MFVPDKFKDDLYDIINSGNTADKTVSQILALLANMHVDDFKRPKAASMPAYGSIGHLPNSRLGEGDHSIDPAQAAICTDGRPGLDVYVQTKLDGACVAVYRDDDILYPITRNGYDCAMSNFEHHRMFARWAAIHYDQIMDTIDPGQKLVGEWLALAHGTIYSGLTDETVFRPFDIFTGKIRIGIQELYYRLGHGMMFPPDCIDKAMQPEVAMAQLNDSGADEPEGVVYKVYRLNAHAFSAKWVQPNKIDGKYLKNEDGTIHEPVWNWHD